MGKLVDQFNSALNELNHALKNRNEYETKLEKIKVNKALSFVERDYEIQVIKSFIAAYEEDIETAKEKIKEAEIEITEWLKNTKSAAETKQVAIDKEIDHLLTISDELNKGVNDIHKRIMAIRNEKNSMERVANNNLTSKQEKEEWNKVLSRIDSANDRLSMKNFQAANVQIELYK